MIKTMILALSRLRPPNTPVMLFLPTSSPQNGKSVSLRVDWSNFLNNVATSGSYRD
eukprot:TRINITY_DN7231_c0_g1_i1.p2 TRINITY_DN7231_c0_g1~~TRINITY_DN7231_c0_g1_i1.p2  ORF type:complete len:56 (-),score=3.95 TRINITY_DN7231_c0_g1_i1:393-560(-)